MSRSQALHRAHEAIGAFESQSVVALGEKRAIDKNGATYVPYSQPHARNNGVVPTAAVTCFLHPSTGALIIVPP